MNRLDAVLRVSLEKTNVLYARAFRAAEAAGVRVAKRPLVEAISEEIRREIEAP